MKLSRLVGLIFLAVLAVGLMAASAALAAAPEFSPGTPQKFKSDSGTGKLETATTGTKVECLTDLDTGEVTGAKTVGNVVVIFHNCHSPESGGCSVKSVGGPNSSLIITNTLDGELGSVKKTEATSGVGLLLLPTTGTEFVSLEGTCLPESPSPVLGSIAGEVTPVNGAASNDGKLIFQGNGKVGGQLIKEINVLGTVVKPTLKALGLLESNEITVDLILYENAVTVT